MNNTGEGFTYIIFMGLLKPAKPARAQGEDYYTTEPAYVKEFSQIKRKKSLGDDLLSQGAAPQVPSALTVLTTGFGM